MTAEMVLKTASRLFRRLIGQSKTIAPDVSIPCEVLGTKYGGHCVALEYLGPESVVYSCGVGRDISFDLELIRRKGCQFFAFDPTPLCLDWIQHQAVPESFHFFNYGIADHDGTLRFYPPKNAQHVSYTVLERPERAGEALEAPVYRLETVFERLGHKRLDVLKMDIEGAEYRVLEDLLASSSVEVDQILAEFHHQFDDVPFAYTRRILEKLAAAGYCVFHVSPAGREVSMIHARLLSA